MVNQLLLLLLLLLLPLTTTTATTMTTTATPVTTIAAAAAAAADTDVQKFFDKCLTSPSLPILFSVLDEPYCKSFAKSADHLPVSLQSIFDPEHLQCTYTLSSLRQENRWQDY